MKKARIRGLRWATGVLLSALLLISGCSRQGQGINTTHDFEADTVVSPVSQQNQKVLIVTGEYAPYVGAQLEGQGIITQMLEEVLKDSGIDYEIKFYPWGRCSEMVKSGDAWAAYPYGHSENNDAAYLFSDVLASTVHKYYYRKDNQKIKEEVYDFDEISDFKNYVFGGTGGYWYGNAKDFATLGVKTEWAADTDSLLKMLASQRIDFFIEDELVCQEAIERLFSEEKEQFGMLPNAAKTQDYYLIISKNYPGTEELREKFNNSLKEWKEEWAKGHPSLEGKEEN